MLEFLWFRGEDAEDLGGALVEARRDAHRGQRGGEMRRGRRGGERGMQMLRRVDTVRWCSGNKAFPIPIPDIWTADSRAVLWPLQAAMRNPRAKPS